jgi:hypothetical protein
VILLISTSQVARVAEVSHHGQLLSHFFPPFNFRNKMKGKQRDFFSMIGKGISEIVESIKTENATS